MTLTMYSLPVTKCVSCTLVSLGSQKPVSVLHYTTLLGKVHATMTRTCADYPSLFGTRISSENIDVNLIRGKKIEIEVDFCYHVDNVRLGLDNFDIYSH